MWSSTELEHPGQGNYCILKITSLGNSLMADKNGKIPLGFQMSWNERASVLSFFFVVAHNFPK